MKSELQDQLKEKYPDVFNPPLAWGIECGDGWYNIIDALCGIIQMNVKYNNAPPVVLTQIKEKFGTLRVYYNANDDRILQGAVMMAEWISAYTCDVCGAPGELRKNGWLRTRCDAHEKEAST